MVTDSGRRLTADEENLFKIDTNRSDYYDYGRIFQIYENDGGSFYVNHYPEDMKPKVRDLKSKDMKSKVADFQSKVDKVSPRLSSIGMGLEYFFHNLKEDGVHVAFNPAYDSNSFCTILTTCDDLCSECGLTKDQVVDLYEGYTIEYWRMYNDSYDDVDPRFKSHNISEDQIQLRMQAHDLIRNVMFGLEDEEIRTLISGDTTFEELKAASEHLESIFRQNVSLSSLLDEKGGDFVESLREGVLKHQEEMTKRKSFDVYYTKRGSYDVYCNAYLDLQERRYDQERFVLSGDVSGYENNAKAIDNLTETMNFIELGYSSFDSKNIDVAKIKCMIQDRHQDEINRFIENSLKLEFERSTMTSDEIHKTEAVVQKLKDDWIPYDECPSIEMASEGELAEEKHKRVVIAEKQKSVQEYFDLKNKLKDCVGKDIRFVENKDLDGWKKNRKTISELQVAIKKSEKDFNAKYGEDLRSVYDKKFKHNKTLSESMDDLQQMIDAKGMNEEGRSHSDTVLE